MGTHTIMTTETVRMLLDLISPLHESLNEATFDERHNEGFMSQPGRRFAVYVTAQEEHDLQQAVAILEKLALAEPVG